MNTMFPKINTKTISVLIGLQKRVETYALVWVQISIRVLLPGIEASVRAVSASVSVFPVPKAP